jgi:hypothetical protein
MDDILTYIFAILLCWALIAWLCKFVRAIERDNMRIKNLKRTRDYLIDNGYDLSYNPPDLSQLPPYPPYPPYYANPNPTPKPKSKPKPKAKPKAVPKPKQPTKK